MPVRLFVGVPWLIALPLLAVYGTFWALWVMLRIALMLIAAFVVLALAAAEVIGEEWRARRGT